MFVFGSAADPISSGRELTEDPVDAALIGSFAASDPPYWTLGVESVSDLTPETEVNALSSKLLSPENDESQGGAESVSRCRA